MVCPRLVSSVGQPGDTTSGGYRIKMGTDYDPSSACSESCDPIAAPCP